MANKRKLRFTIAVGADHGGFLLKRRLIQRLSKAGHSVKDFGTYTPKACDYPLMAYQVARAVSQKKFKRGLLICKSGVGMSMAANKVPGVRAGSVSSLRVAAKSRQHNDTNVLVLGAVGLSTALASKIVQTWLATPFDGGRHLRRVRQIQAIERKTMKRKVA